MNRKTPHRASILIIALWSLALLSTFAVIVGYEVRQKILLIQRLQQRDQGRLTADAAVKAAIAMVRDQSRKDFDGLNDPWSNNRAVFEDHPVGSTRFTVSYALDTPAPDGTVQTGYGLVDEERKINLNKATSKVIARLLRQAGIEESLSQDIASAIVDWRDEDSQLSTPGSAEDTYYHMLRYPYETKDGDFQVLEEVLLVKGMTENIFQKVRGYITIYGNGRVNVNTVSRTVLIALGFTEDMADKIISVRDGKDEQPGTNDDAPFASIQDISARVSQSYRLTDQELTDLVSLAQDVLTVQSNNFLVQASVWEGKKKIAEARAVFDRAGSVFYRQEF